MAARKGTPIHVACTAVLLEPVSCPLLLAPRRAEAMAAMDVTQTQRCITAPDPLADWFETFLTLSEQDDLLQHLHCQDLFQGIGAGDGCYATVRQWLQEIWEDDREHREVAADSRFTTRTLLPKPFEISLRAVARKEGWETETLMAPFLGNIGWMESPGVRLRLHEDEERTRSCVVQVVCAGEPSMRKSSLKDFAAKTLLSHADVPEILRTGAAWSSDGTIKGIRGSIQVHNRAGPCPTRSPTSAPSALLLAAGATRRACSTATRRSCAHGSTARMTEAEHGRAAARCPATASASGLRRGQLV